MYWRKRFDNKTRKNVSVNHNSVIHFLSFIKKKIARQTLFLTSIITLVEHFTFLFNPLIERISFFYLLTSIHITFT